MYVTLGKVEGKRRRGQTILEWIDSINVDECIARRREKFDYTRNKSLCDY